ncbi:MAG TPA: NUDIX domain-containing protein [Feifaniaceae bacterium]|nr:NUDIX domain-containing protein [Feifaniaceae bacterium]
MQARWKEDAPSENGLLEIPAGKIRAFESIFDALRREIKEETGLSVTEILGEDGAQVYNAVITGSSTSRRFPARRTWRGSTPSWYSYSSAMWKGNCCPIPMRRRLFGGYR